jgi:glycogen synthase
MKIPFIASDTFPLANEYNPASHPYLERNYDSTTIERAEESLYHQEEWQNLMRRNMKLHLSWKASAREHEEIYLRARNPHQ